MIKQLQFKMDCPNCKREKALCLIAGYEPDGDDDTVYYEFAFRFENQECSCDLYGLDLLDEVREEAGKIYEELY